MTLIIGLLNNMPDAALHATERQFGELLTAAAGGRDVELRFYSLPEVERGEHARTFMRDRYHSVGGLAADDLDGLIVTGNKPRASDLTDEPYWPSLTRVIDLTRDTALPTVWSCLAAHAAVLHLDGVRRRPLPTKCSGVFDCRKVGDDPILAGLPGVITTPHSRQNALDEADLVAAGYQILTRSKAAGVDAFIKRGPALALFFQGHPEYDADSLLREYVRDVSRFVKGERSTPPALPEGSFDIETEQAFTELAQRADWRCQSELMADYADIAAHAQPNHAWRGGAVAIYRNWLSLLAARRAAMPAPAAAPMVRRVP